MDANAFDIRSEEAAHSDEVPASERKPAQAPSFRVKDGARVRVSDAGLLASVMARLITEERGTAADLVNEARSAKSPIHHCFEWNDAKAAESHRLDQASRYWRAIELTVQAED